MISRIVIIKQNSEENNDKYESQTQVVEKHWKDWPPLVWGGVKQGPLNKFTIFKCKWHNL